MLIDDLVHPKFVFHSPVLDPDPLRPLGRAGLATYVERAIAAWNLENGIDPMSVPTARDAAIELLEPCLGDSMRIDLWVEELDDQSCVYGFLCSSEDGLVPFARGEETVTRIGSSAWSAAFRHTHAMLMKELPASA